jgi:hypothetical protein
MKDKLSCFESSASHSQCPQRNHVKVYHLEVILELETPKYFEVISLEASDAKICEIHQCYEKWIP